MKADKYIKTKCKKHKHLDPPIKGSRVYVLAHHDLKEVLEDYAEKEKKQEAIEFMEWYWTEHGLFGDYMTAKKMYEDKYLNKNKDES